MCAVIGAGPGLGRAIAAGAAREGATVVLAARDEDRLRSLMLDLQLEDPSASLDVAPCDVTSTASCDALMETIRGRFGRLDVLFHNAFAQPAMQPVAASSDADWTRSFDVNVTGAVRTVRAAVPLLRDSPHGAVVLTGSMSAARINQRFGAYAAAKAALEATGKTLALEHGRDGIRVNVLAPGFIWGPNVEAWFDWQASERGVTPQVIYDEVAADIALGRIPTADEIAGSAVFLASDLAAAVTGVCLDANGGHHFR